MTTSGGYTIVQFEVVANCTWTVPTNVVGNIATLVVGGGGGGGADRGGGGGGGGVFYSSGLSIAWGETLTINVGSGGGGSNGSKLNPTQPDLNLCDDSAAVAAGSGGSSSITWTGKSISAAGGAGGVTGTPGDRFSNVGGAGGAVTLSGVTATTSASGKTGATGANTSGANARAGVDGTSITFVGVAGTYGSSAGSGSWGGASALGGTNAGRGEGGGQISTGGAALFGGGGGGSGRCTSYGGRAGGSGVIKLAYQTFAVTSFATTSSSPTNANPIPYTLVFSEAIDSATLTGADFTNGGTSTGCQFAVVRVSATTYTINVSGCSDGTVTPTLALNSVTRAAGGNGPGAAYPANTVTLDRTAPATPTDVALSPASDTGSSNSDSVTNDNTPAVSATVSGGQNGEVVTITAAKPGSAPVSCSYTLPATSCDLGTLEDGTWSLSATRADALGNQSPASTPRSISVDTATSAGTPDLLPSSDLGSSSTDNVTSDATPAISAVGADEGDTVTVTASRPGFASVSCTYVKSPTVTSCDLGTLADGDWSVSTSATDPAGNTAGPSAGLNISVDTTPPATPSTPDLLPASDSGSSDADNLTSDNTPAVSGGTVADGDTVKITARKADGTTVSCTYVASATANSCDLPTMSDGDWSIDATVTDPAGNVSNPGPSLPVSIDTTPPTTPSAPDLLPASDTGSSNADDLTADNTPTVSGGSVANGNTVTMAAKKADGTTVSCSYVASPTVSSCDLPTMSDGDWAITSAVTDTAGNTSPVSPPLNVRIDTTPPNPVAPDLLPTSDNGPSQTDNNTNDATPAFSMPNAIDGDEVTFTAKKSDGSIASCSYVKSATVNSCDLPALSDGQWSVNAVVKDASGNQSGVSPSLSMVVDTVPPEPPAPPTIPVNPKQETGDPTPFVDIGKLSPGETGTATATKADKAVECSVSGGPNVTGCDLPQLSPGQWSVSATVTDAAGNESAPSEPVEIEIIRVGLPDDAASLDAASALGVRSRTTVSATLKASELGKVANVVFVIRNADGSIARTVRVVAPTKSTKVVANLKSIRRGQRVSVYTENWLGVSPRAPREANVVRSRTVRTLTKSGMPRLLGDRAGVGRIIFDPASALLDAADKANLDSIASRLFDKGGLVLVSGFARQNLTDSKRFLTDLSVARAAAVANYLSSQGVRAWIRYEGYGAVTTREGTWEDRKVEIRWADGATELPAK